MPRPDEGLIHAWLDGELSPDEAARVEQLVRDDAEWSAAAAEARGLVAASSRILGALDDVPGDVMPRGSRAAGSAARAATREPAKPRLRFAARPWVRAAAGVVLVVGTTVAVRSVQQEPVAKADTGMSGGIAATAAAAAAERQESDADADAPAPPTAPPTAPSTARRAVTPAAPDLAGEAAPMSVPAPAPAPPVVPMVARAAEQANQEAEDRARTLSEIRSERTAPSGRAMPERALDSPHSISALAASAMLAPQALATRTLEGCWQRESAGTQDTLLTALMIERANADSLELRLDTQGRVATVLRTADTLRGTDRQRTGATAPFVAVRVECPPAAPPGGEPAP